MKKIILIITLILIMSCDVLKNKSTNKNDSSLTENIETKTFRKGDTVTYVVPKVTLKDTTIYTYNRQGTTLKTVYDKSGSIASIDCFASAIEEIKKENREFQQNILDQQKIKESAPNTQWIWAVCIGFVLIVSVIIFFFYLYMKSVTPKL